jgi:hypothetical protein
VPEELSVESLSGVYVLSIVVIACFLDFHGGNMGSSQSVIPDDAQLAVGRLPTNIDSGRPYPPLQNKPKTCNFEISILQGFSPARPKQCSLLASMSGSPRTTSRRWIFREQAAQDSPESQD